MAAFISLASGPATWSHKAHAARRLIGVQVSMAVGAFVGAWMLRYADSYAPVLLAPVIAIASLALKHEPA
jgi:uncharacterized membrane protein YfcA